MYLAVCIPNVTGCTQYYLTSYSLRLYMYILYLPVCIPNVTGCTQYYLTACYMYILIWMLLMSHVIIIPIIHIIYVLSCVHS